MDLESIKSLAWLLLWGVAFFAMMRFGCGAHMMGGHHGGHERHGDHDPAPPATAGEIKDPVCGMTIASPSAAAAAAVHQGRTYYFCSASCRDKFEQAPDQYASAQLRGGHHG